jgi:L-ascorbate metabolism protein UlaG (beta-lactamase superfamily)
LQIKWFGQSCFEVKSNNQTLIFDPYSSMIGLSLPKLSADIVLVTHNHPDHNNSSEISGIGEKKLFVIISPGEYEISGIKIDGVSSFHDKNQGAERGKNTIYIVDLEDIRICHLGDQGALLTDEELEEIGEVDILFVPVGGTYTINASEALEVINQIDPRIVIPMHYNISGVASKLDGIEKFASQEKIADLEGKDILEIKKNDLPSDEREIVILKPQK